MPKKSTKVTVLSAPAGANALVSSLVPRARRLPVPSDYYAGRIRSGRALPDNILLFHRTKSKDLLRSMQAPHFNQRHALIISLQGAGTVIIDGRRLSLTPRHCVLVRPYQFHSYAGFPEDWVDWMFVSFDYPESPANLEFLNGKVFFPPELFWGRLEELTGEFQKASDDRSGDRLSWHLALMLEDLRISPSLRRLSRTAAGYSLLMKVHEFAGADLRRAVSIGDVAGYLGMSPSHLREKFHRESGRSLGSFLKAIRLQRAAELLARGQANVTEVSEACGWQTPYAFSRAFRRYWGRPPKRFALAKRQGIGAG